MVDTKIALKRSHLLSIRISLRKLEPNYVDRSSINELIAALGTCASEADSPDDLEKCISILSMAIEFDPKVESCTMEQNNIKVRLNFSKKSHLSKYLYYIGLCNHKVSVEDSIDLISVNIPLQKLNPDEEYLKNVYAIMFYLNGVINYASDNFIYNDARKCMDVIIAAINSNAIFRNAVLNYNSSSSVTFTFSFENPNHMRFFAYKLNDINSYYHF